MERSIQTLILLLFIVLLTNPVLGETFLQNSNFNITHAVRINGAINANSSCDITVYQPNKNSAPLIDFQAMTSEGDRFSYPINSSQSSIKGIYPYDVTCIGVGLNETNSFSYLVNLGGVEPSQERTDTLGRTIWMFFGLALFMFIAIFFIQNVPLKVSFFLLFIWFLLMGINTSFITLQDEVVNTSIENFFSFFLTASYLANWFILLSIGLIWIIVFTVSVIERKKIKKVIEYG